MEQPQQQQQHLLHFSHSNHPLLFEQDNKFGLTCCGCQESVYGPTYSCRECSVLFWREFVHHKSCAELPLGLHHPLHPIHPLILFDEKTHYPEQEEEDKQKTKCQVCNESRRQYTYRCYRCDFNLHATCASLPPTIKSSQVHHHPLTPFWKWMSFTCDLCAKKVKGIPNQCALCSYCVHNTCASLPRTLKVEYHRHPLHLTHSSLEVELHQSDFRFCQRCAQKVNTNSGFYYCSKCNFVVHLDCAVDYRYRENINLLKFKEEENEDPEIVDLEAYKVKNMKVGEDGSKIASEIQHFSHEHELKLSDDELYTMRV
uniref:DC1 domain-containing protein n=1 Tax=Quercus lobata TaxID=97700 RepID=A0A7N2R0P7_QUELO